jgi:hypothetical protein
VIRQRGLEMLPIPLLLMAAVQYVHFKQGADVHIFWPQYFAPYFALGIGALTATLREVVAWAAGRWIGGKGEIAALRSRAPWLALVVTSIPLAFVFRDGASMIRLAHETGGRFNSPMIQSDVDKTVAFQWFLRRFPPAEKIAFHPGLLAHWALMWELRPHVLLPDQPPGSASSSVVARLYFLDTRYTNISELKQVASTFHVHAVGPYWMIDRKAPAAPLDGFSFDEREPGFWDWYLRGGTEPTRSVRPDPWVTWEWRSALGQTALPPRGEPVTLEQIRVAYNVAVKQNDQAQAARMRSVLENRLTVPRGVTYDNQGVLIGIDHHWGAQRSINAYFLGGSFKGHAKFAINSKVDSPARFSTLALDKAELDMAPPPMIPTELWEGGLIYSVRVPYRKRPGTERFFGWFVPLDGKPAPKRVGRPATVDLVVLKG